MKPGMTRWKEEPLNHSGLPLLPLPFSPARREWGRGRSGGDGWVDTSAFLFPPLRLSVEQEFEAAPRTGAERAEVLGRVGHHVRAQLRPGREGRKEGGGFSRRREIPREDQHSLAMGQLQKGGRNAMGPAHTRHHLDAAGRLAADGDVEEDWKKAGS